jgi:hypothetical protein
MFQSANIHIQLKIISHHQALLQEYKRVYISHKKKYTKCIPPCILVIRPDDGYSFLVKTCSLLVTEYKELC